MGSNFVKKICVYSKSLKKLLEKNKSGVNISLLNRINVGVFYIKDPNDKND